MGKSLAVGLALLGIVAVLAPPGRSATTDLISAGVPWVEGGDDGEAVAGRSPAAEADDNVGDRAVPPGEAPDDGAGLQDGPIDDGNRADAGAGATEGSRRPADHDDGPPADLEISDDLPIPPLAPGVGTLDEAVARPATPSGPHWVPFKGNHILWCVYRGAGRCNGHHPYPAIDVDMDPGTPIYAAGPGTVYEACNRGDACGGYGSHARIRHLNNVRSIYGHFTRTVVRAGQTVRTGDLLGYSGCTGNCNGAHLHYEERNAAEQSIQIGQMQGYSGQRVVTYPNTWGYSAWTGIPPDVLRIRNDFFPDDDRDDDGTFDKDESCLSRPGPISNNGCPLPRNAPSSGDAAVRDGAGNLRHHVVDENGHLWQLTEYPRGWEWVDRGAPGAGLAGGDVVAVRADDGTSWVLGVDTAGVLWAGRQPQNQWLWTEIGSQGGGFVGTPAATGTWTERMVVHAVDQTGSLWRAVYEPATGWTWADLGRQTNGFTGSTPVSFHDGADVLNTAIIDTAGRLHRFTLGPNGGDTVRVETTPATTMRSNRPAVIADRAGLPSIFVTGHDGHLWRFLKSYAGPWVWVDHGAVPGGIGDRSITAWRDTDLNLHVLVVDSAGRLRVSNQFSTIFFAWTSLGARGALATIGSPSTAIDAAGVGHVFIVASGQVHEAESIAGGPWTVRPSGGPPLR